MSKNQSGLSLKTEWHMQVQMLLETYCIVH